MPIEEPARRDFVARCGAYALATLPVAASAVETPVQGLQVETLQIARPDAHALSVYCARPAAAKGPLPVVLLVSEIFGVHAHIADVARRFAQSGYLCLAPELFARQGDVHQQPDVPGLIREIVGKVPDAQVMGDLDACLDWALAHGGSARVAVTGFCWGGRITWLYAAHQPKVKAAVAWYGRVVGQPNALQPQHAIDQVGALKAPVLGLYGGQDQGIPLASVARMQEALKGGSAAARASEFVVYREAGHAFHADNRPSYREADARDAWARGLAWMRQHGV